MSVEDSVGDDDIVFDECTVVAADVSPAYDGRVCQCYPQISN